MSCVVSLVRKWAKESQMSTQQCRKPWSSDPLLFWVDGLKVNCGSLVPNCYWGLEVSRFPHYVIIRDNFQFCLRAEKWWVRSLTCVPVGDQAVTQVDLPCTGSKSVYSHCTMCSQLSACPTSTGSTNSGSNVSGKKNVQKVPNCTIRICHVQAIIYIAFTLCLQLLT